MLIRPSKEVPFPPRRSHPNRRILVVGLALVLVMAGGGYSIWWRSAANDVRAQALAWIAERRSEGWQITFADTNLTGFPLYLGVSLDDAHAAPESGEWAWNSERVRLTLPIFAPPLMRLEFIGQQALDIATEDVQRSYAGTAESLTFDIVPSTSWLPNGRLAVRTLALRDAANDDTLSLEQLDLTSTGDPAATTDEARSAYEAHVALEALHLPQVWATPLGRDGQHVEIAAKLNGTLKAHPWPAALGEWRDGGGDIDITRLTIITGPTSLDGDGTFALDRDGQPIGAMTIRLQGYEAALDRLANENTIAPFSAATAKILLRSIARSELPGDAAGVADEPPLSAPLSIQDGQLSLGPVPLLTLPPLHWLDRPSGR
ncbi:MAG: DUF2125 domain-containing protein [Rhodospirillales bacterium]|nr:DUF2125 domain-containing protein [Rhodospirillales bacterium]